MAGEGDSDSLPEGWETGADRNVMVNPGDVALEFAPARNGGPGRKAYRTGDAASVGLLADKSDFEKALRIYDEEKLAHSSKMSQAAHVNQWIS